jgi:Flp pilus assembly protein TadD
MIGRLRSRSALPSRLALLAVTLSAGCVHNPLRSVPRSEPTTLPPPVQAEATSAEELEGASDAIAPDRQKLEIAENLRKGHAEAEAGRFDQAARYYERVLRDDPCHFSAHHQLAIVADQARDFRTAERHYLAALEARPGDVAVLSDLGHSYLLQHRYDECERTLREALAMFPEDRSAVTNLAALYGAMGDSDRATAVLRSAGPADTQSVRVASLTAPPRTSGPTDPSVQQASIDGRRKRPGLIPPPSAPASVPKRDTVLTVVARPAAAGDVPSTRTAEAESAALRRRVGNAGLPLWTPPGAG